MFETTLPGMESVDKDLSDWSAPEPELMDPKQITQEPNTQFSTRRTASSSTLVGCFQLQCHPRDFYACLQFEMCKMCLLHTYNTEQ